jgi:two-component system chemotaxis sensor kinase CheA
MGRRPQVPLENGRSGVCGETRRMNPCVLRGGFGHASGLMGSTQTPPQPQLDRGTTAKRGWSITQKLVALIVLTSGAIIALLTSYFLSQQIAASHSALERKAASYGHLVSKQVASAIAFDDQETAREVFDSVAQDQDVESLVLMTATGATLYVHGAPGAWIAAAKGGVIAQHVLQVGDRTAVVAPVLSAEGPRGTLVIELSNGATVENNRRLMRTALSVASLSLLFGALLAYAIARSFGRRLAQISRVASAVTAGELAQQPVEIAGSDEIALLGRAFNAMLQHIQGLVQQIRTNAEDEQIRLESVVSARTQELHQRNADMRLVLDNVDQGFLGVDLRGDLSPERSAIVSHWLGEARAGETLFSWVERSFAGKGDVFRVAWDGLVEEWMPLEMRIDQLPRELQTPDRCFAFAYKPVFEGEKLDKLLVVITDTTALLAKRRAEEEEQELAQVVRKLLQDRNGFRDFVAEADELISAIEVSNDWQRLRHLHTLKGNAAIFGFTSLSRLCHEIEDAVQERVSSMTADELQKLRNTWTRLKDKVSVLTESRSNALEISHADFDQLLARIDAHAPPAELRALIAKWRLTAVESRLARLADYARALAERLGKSPIDVRIEANGVRLDPQAWTHIWQSLVHVVRNAIDHGLETSDERIEKHKPNFGSLVLRTRLDGKLFKIDVEDDGRGIDWEQVARVAKKRGLPHQTPDQLNDALWADGLSTREQATDTSGRGVGLSAVKQVCLETGGLIRIQSEAGRGSCFSFEWMLDATGRPQRQVVEESNSRYVQAG